MTLHWMGLPGFKFRTMRHFACLALIATLACSGEPVEWGETVYANFPRAPLEFPGALQSVPSADACPGSLRVAKNGSHQYAAWWESQPDSSVLLFFSRLTGRVWSASVVADSSDRGARGCGRPAPGIAADDSSGYIHLAYFSEPESGAGIFFAHSMDSGATFHSPVPIVFGRNPSRVSVASDGDRVAVAYEDPNASQPLIGIALSKTMGHIFESRIQGTSESGRARQPVVRIAGDSIRLWWSEYSADPAVSATRPRYRAGLWKGPRSTHDEREETK